MNFVSCPVGHIASRQSRLCLRYSSWNRSSLLASVPASRHRCFHSTSRRLTVEGEGEGLQSVADASFWNEYKASFASTHESRVIAQMPVERLGKEAIVLGFLTKITSISKNLCFAGIKSGTMKYRFQVSCHGTALCEQLRSIRLHSAVRVKGKLVQKREQNDAKPQEPDTRKDTVDYRAVEVVAAEILCLNSVADDVHISQYHNYPPQSRHLQIRFDESLQYRLYIRSRVASYIRKQLIGGSFLEMETPILFKSSPEGAREFLVPTRKPGYAYALPQSPQQYKQILMATGVERYFQFAKCFRDEDLRADRQPEFTQLDVEIAYADGGEVMRRIEALIKDIYANFFQYGGPIKKLLPDSPFIRMTYEEAMSKHGSDKPDLRIKGLIHRIDNVIPDELRGMLTSIEDPIIEACKLRLDCEPERVQSFMRNLMDSPDAEPFISNVDGAPGFCVYDSRKPVEGLQTFGFEGAEKLKALYNDLRHPGYQSEELHAVNSTFEDGDLLIIQARQNLPHSGGSTILGKLRLAIYKAAVAEGLIQPDPDHHYLWVTEFPMFTPNNDTDPGQGGTSGFSATHHPFTAPLSPEDVDLLLTDPLKAKADHYDLVVNGVELGGGSRRIHNAEMQKFIMRDIIKMSEERMNDFSHLFEALRSGCPPHAGFAIGFDRLIAVMTGVESVKDVIFFPKSSTGEDVMVKSPAPMTNAELSRYHLQLTSPVKTEEGGENGETSSEVKVEEMKSEPPSQS